jgi:Phosphate-selective porin O and P
VTSRVWGPALAACALLASAPSASAQVELTAGEDVNFKLGILGQFQADSLDDGSGGDRINNLFVRRLRLMFGGQVAKRVTFFVETDAPNLGKTLAPGGKNIQPSMIVQDAYGEFAVSGALSIDAGLMFVPFSRNSLQSAATLLPIDYGPYTFSQSAPTQSATGRDAGFQARGYLLDEHLEYRVGAFQGARDARSDNGFRYAGRIQYELFDTETGFFYTGTYLGKKKVLAVGAAFDTQDHYHAYNADAFLDLPAGPGAFTGQLAYNHFDGGITLATLPKQDDVLFEAGYLIAPLKLTPVLQWSRRDVTDIAPGADSQWSAGLNYWWAAHNANVKAAYSRIALRGKANQNEMTVQLQLFYF